MSKPLLLLQAEHLRRGGLLPPTLLALIATAVGAASNA